MWLPWLTSRRRLHSSPRPNSPTSPNFTLSSFKDVENLFNDEHVSPPDTKPHHHHHHHHQQQQQQPEKPPIFQRTRSSACVLRAWAYRKSSSSVAPSTSSNASSQPSNGSLDDQRVVLYFTSLHVVRRTFEDCRTVRSILRGYRVPIDERDLSMDCGFIDELGEIMKSMDRTFSLPAVFIGGKYVGGAEEIKDLQESRKLIELIGSLPRGGSTVGYCELCGGLQFVLCEQCNGSHKVYSQKIGFRSCTYCNANGLIRCPSCCSLFLRCASSHS